MVDGTPRAGGDLVRNAPVAGAFHGEIVALAFQGTTFDAAAEAGRLSVPVLQGLVYAGANTVHARRIASGRPFSPKEAAALDSLVRGDSVEDSVSRLAASGFPNADSVLERQVRTTGDAIRGAVIRTERFRASPVQVTLYMESSAAQLLREHVVYDGRGTHQAVRLLARQLTNPDNTGRLEELTTALLHQFSDSNIAPPAVLPSDALRDGLFRLRRRYTQWAERSGLPEDDEARRLMESLLQIDDPGSRQSFRQILAARPADAATLRELLAAHLQAASAGIAALQPPPAPPPPERPPVSLPEKSATAQPRGRAARAAGAAVLVSGAPVVIVQKPAATSTGAGGLATARRPRSKEGPASDTLEESLPDSPPARRGGRSDETADTVGVYLKEIGRTPLLSAAQEVELAKAIEAGLFAAERLAAGTDKPDSQDAADLREIVALGEAAKNRMVEANLRLVVSIARGNTRTASTMTFLDLIQEGNTGLMKAVEKFDYAQGFKFSTYATWWIRQAITRGVSNQEREVRLPVHLEDTLKRMDRARRDLVRDLQRDPTDQELAKAMRIKPRKLQELREYSARPVSLDGFVGDSDDATLGDLVVDTDTEGGQYEAAFEASTLVESLEAFLTKALKAKVLDEREVGILRHRNGLVDGRVWTYEEIAAKFKVSRERIRQLEGPALARLRWRLNLEELRPYLG